MGASKGARRIPKRVRTRCLIISPIREDPRATRFTKRQTGMPSEYTMQFFTPELYLRFNSKRDEEALAADAEWESAITRYNKHLESLRSDMASQVVNLTELCLHDAEVLLRREQQEPLKSPCGPEWSTFGPLVPWYGTFTLAVQQDQQVLAIVYFLADHVTEKQPVEAWPFSKSREHWLYDEINASGRAGGHFVHNVLLSTGIVLSIPFSTVLIERFSVTHVQEKKRSKKAV